MRGLFGVRDTRPTLADKQREKAAKIMKSLTGPCVDKALGGPYLCPGRVALRAPRVFSAAEQVNLGLCFPHSFLKPR